MLHDLAHALRSLYRRPAFFVASMITLTIVIAANVTMFSLFNGIVLRPMPFGDRTDRVVSLHSTHRLQAADWDNSPVSYADLLDLRRQARSFEQIGGYLTRNIVLSSEANAERLVGVSVTPEVFPLIGAEPALGRQFTADDAAPMGLETVVLLTHGVWQRHYGGDPAIVGRTVLVNDRPRTVVGVMPEGFRFPHVAQIYLPLRLDEDARGARNVIGIALLDAGVSVDQAQTEAGDVAARLAADYPATNDGFGIRVLTFRDAQVDPRARVALGTVVMAVVFLLLIACANLANLLFVRGAARQRDMAVRAAMGATRVRLMGQILGESAIVAVAGTALGMLGAAWWTSIIPATYPEDLPYWLRLDLDMRVAAFTAGLTVLTTLAVGLLPALRVSRPRAALAEQGRSLTLTRSSHRVQQTLAVAQVAFCLALLVGAHLMIRSFLSLQRADLGFDDRPVLSMRVYLAGDAYDEVPIRAAFFERVVAALETVPGVTAAAATTSVPGDDGGASVRVARDVDAANRSDIGAQLVTATPRLLDALGLRPREGRVFTAGESADPESDAAIVNERLARRLRFDGSPVGQRIGIVSNGEVSWRRIVGVAPDMVYEELGEGTDQSQLTVYLPYARTAPRTMALLVRGTGDPAALIGPARDALRGVHPGLAVYDVLTMADRRRVTAIDRQIFGNLMGGFAAAALLLACLGIYALLADTVRQRTPEIGVRLALGASPRRVVSMFVGEGAAIAAVGLVFGLLMAIGLARGMTGLLFGVDPLDPLPMAGTSAALLAVVLVAVYVPARRASRVNPLAALRAE